AVKISNVKLVFTTAEPGSEGGDPQAIASTLRLNATGKTFQVFDMQGRLLGNVDVVNGSSLNDALKAKFNKAGVYMVKQGNMITQVRVAR
ncbi:MAG: T9SS type A sorting domain-containing protein, partial [Fibrobacteraceae bacterium]|nr:T9SS type A sorting domain-containing protein [Fibrobacteraceae bacterium]